MDHPRKVGDIKKKGAWSTGGRGWSGLHDHIRAVDAGATTASSARPGPARLQRSHGREESLWDSRHRGDEEPLTTGGSSFGPCHSGGRGEEPNVQATELEARWLGREIQTARELGEEGHGGRRDHSHGRRQVSGRPEARRRRTRAAGGRREGGVHRRKRGQMRRTHALATHCQRIHSGRGGLG